MTTNKLSANDTPVIPVFAELESFLRVQIQRFIQELLEEEVTAFIGRKKSERRAEVDAPPIYRNGHGKPRRLATTSGTIELRRPRMRGLDESFESQILPLFGRKTKEVGEILPELYLHGSHRATLIWP